MRRAWLYLVFALIVPVALLVISTGGAAQPTLTEGTPTAIGRGGAVATVETLASEAAVEALRDGANAVDAAVVAAAVLGVTEPFSCGIGGGGFMVIRTSDGEVTTIDHRETAPAAMRPNSFFENGVPLPFNDARYSGLSAGVPGTVRGWDEALNRFGTMSLAAGPAAGESKSPARASSSTRPSSTRRSRTSTTSTMSPRPAALYLDPDGTPRDVGTVLRNPDLARAYAADRPLGRQGLLPRRDRGRHGRGGPAPADRPGGEPRLAPRADDHARRQGLLGARARADEGRLPRARRLQHGSSVERRLD